MTERKATDILLSLETKVNQLIELYRSQDLILKLLLNKLNSNGSIDNSQNIPSPPPNVVVNPPKVVDPTENLPMEVAPLGFRRTSRPETYTEPAKPIVKSKLNNTIVAPKVEATPVQNSEFKPEAPSKAPSNNSSIKSAAGKVPVEQRIVDKNGKAIYLADIEITSVHNPDSSFKIRTNSIGKWQAALDPGNYKVRIKKMESLTKEKIDITQEIMIDGLSKTQELPVLIIK